MTGRKKRKKQKSKSQKEKKQSSQESKKEQKGTVIISPTKIGAKIPLKEAVEGGAKKIANKRKDLFKERIENLKELTKLNERRKKSRKEPLDLSKEIRSLGWSPQYAHAGERLSLVKKLKKEGYNVKVIAPRDEEIRKEFQEFIEKAEELGAEKIESRETQEELISFIRDQEKKVGDTIFKSKDAKGDILAQAGEKGKGRIRSGAGEGGKVIDAGNCILASEDLSEKEIKQLKKAAKDKEVYKLPTKTEKKEIKSTPKKKLAEEELEATHIDHFVNTIPKRNIMLVQPEYYRENKEKIDQIAKKEKLEVVKSSKSEKNQNHLISRNYLMEEY